MNSCGHPGRDDGRVLEAERLVVSGGQGVVATQGGQQRAGRRQSRAGGLAGAQVFGKFLEDGERAIEVALQDANEGDRGRVARPVRAALAVRFQDRFGRRPRPDDLGKAAGECLVGVPLRQLVEESGRPRAGIWRA